MVYRYILPILINWFFVSIISICFFLGALPQYYFLIFISLLACSYVCLAIFSLTLKNFIAIQIITFITFPAINYVAIFLIRETSNQ